MRSPNNGRAPCVATLASASATRSVAVMPDAFASDVPGTRREGTRHMLDALRGEVGDWLARAGRLIPRADRHVLLNPPRLVARFAKYAVHRTLGHAGEVAADEIGARDPEFVTLLCDLFRILGDHYFRFRVDGLEHVPPGPVLLVGNHSGGLLPSEGFFTALALHDRFGPS